VLKSPVITLVEASLGVFCRITIISSSRFFLLAGPGDGVKCTMVTWMFIPEIRT